MTNKDKTVKNISVSTISNNDMYSSKPPAGVKITDRSVSIRTEKIENGFLIVKDVSGKWYNKDKKDTSYFNYTEKYYSKTDPMEVTFKDKSLADMFSDD